MKRILLAIMMLSVLSLVACSNGQNPTTETAQIAEANPELQQRRLALINDLIEQGIFYKVEVPSTLPHVWVTSKFYALNFDDKEEFVGVVYSYYISQNPQYDIVVLYDNKTGQRVGAYSRNYGGLKMD